ncbi:iron-siderophore ABC transporter substrate-binding protein [Pseudonocardia broussonetiae]|uniref:Iron-siderophore ABC transporter substrate-binding protein n=1 Tax=Pseudonocardia broussonetiae TaxID=2736640 RepID=A0A6M6JKF9_9PSEU|nr:iron-siderophore ABC transporter substrate-binding protein [Pseudonocardia broussonetiae]QJY47673.1 iron-siderophore ABC transporter substrate-binding protein [Pseudonocardia broussonetiae]
MSPLPVPPLPRTRSRGRRAATLLATAALLAGAAACGGAAPEPADPAAPAGGAYPVSIEHKYGSTEIAATPERIVLVGLNEQDALLALGTVPVGTSKFLEAPGGIFPWAEEALGGAPLPTLIDQTDGIPYEQVAALAPDLIIGLYSGLTQEDYDTLSGIAPTVAQPAGQEDYTISWQDTTTTLGRILGKEDEAAALVADTEAVFAQARDAHPEFAGRTAVMATLYEGYYFYGADDVRGRTLTSLGFTVPADLDQFVGADGFGGTVPGERVSLLDVDALVWLAEESTESTLRADALYSSLGVVSEGREVFVADSEDVYDAVSFVTPLSIPFVVENLVPRLSAAVDGDPVTVAPAA